MKFNHLLLMMSVASFLGCASVRSSEPEIQLPSVHVSRLEQAVKLRNIAANEVWPGYGDFLPSVVYFTKDSQFLINPGGVPPSEYVLSKTTGPSWGQKVYLASHWTGPTGQQLSDQEIKNEYVANGFSSRDTNGHFSFSVFFLDSLEQFHLKGNNWKLDDWYAVFWHEVFHNFQNHLYDQNLIPDEIRDFKHVAENSKSEDFLKNVRLEQKDLSKALKTSDVKLKRKILCIDLTNKRENRYKKMSQISVSAEQFNEISEGTARYVEEKLSALVGRHLVDDKSKAAFGHENFSFMEKYMNNSVMTFADSILKISPENLYFYNSGFSLSLVLDQVQSNWKTTSFKKKGFLYGELMDWCQVKKIRNKK